MLRFKTLSVKNFMSVGEQTQTLDFTNENITLVLGENLDTTDDKQVGRNGAGKSALFNALSFALFGVALTNIRRDNLINNINARGMVVVLEFERDGHKYRVERGRKPNIFKLMVDDQIVNAPDTDESQGESRHTQEELERITGLTHTLFRNIIVLNTSTTPFLNMTAKDQRDFIEELLGIRLLTEKSDVLKDNIKATRENFKIEEARIETIKRGNERISKTIENLRVKEAQWFEEQANKIVDIQSALESLQALDVEQEIVNQQALLVFRNNTARIQSLRRELTRLESDFESNAQRVVRYQRDLKTAQENRCPTCEQSVHDHTHEKIQEEIQTKLTDIETKQIALAQDINERNQELSELQSQTLSQAPEVYYDSLDQAYNHKNSLDLLNIELNNLLQAANPFTDQIANMELEGIQDPDYENINALAKVLEHQEFLLKLLTNKDSFVRKRIIDQNLAYLNNRLSEYLGIINLPHIVRFMSDLSVEITYMGRELDFDNLSRGEKNRLILALSWSFRDVYEVLNNPINVVLIDELLDNGSDAQLVDGAMQVIRKMHQERNKDVMIISHRDELVSKIGNVLLVSKEGGFTTLERIEDYQN